MSGTVQKSQKSVNGVKDRESVESSWRNLIYNQTGGEIMGRKNVMDRAAGLAKLCLFATCGDSELKSCTGFSAYNAFYFSDEKQHNTELVVDMVRQQFKKHMHETYPEKIQKLKDDKEFRKTHEVALVAPLPLGDMVCELCAEKLC
ncbi:hypothetical protein IFM89_018736 [Coptis chinensis]|uniref:Uncharacterized protein n=1 Tax=Coptis chinensis TaxID=261450 RepID=A0A835HNJ2_9MAGN|nr:hypothetical protein IFM89_018736 [Coptis chinensis]